MVEKELLAALERAREEAQSSKHKYLALKFDNVRLRETIQKLEVHEQDKATEIQDEPDSTSKYQLGLQEERENLAKESRRAELGQQVAEEAKQRFEEQEQKLHLRISEIENQMEQYREREEKAKGVISRQDGEIEKLKKVLKSAQDLSAQSQTFEIQQRDIHIRELEEDVARLKEFVHQRERQVDEFRAKLDNSKDVAGKHREEIESLKIQLSQSNSLQDSELKDEEIKSLKSEKAALETVKGQFDKLKGDSERLLAELNEVKHEETKYENIIQDQRKTLLDLQDQHNREMEAMRQRLAKAEEHGTVEASKLNSNVAMAGQHQKEMEAMRRCLMAAEEDLKVAHSKVAMATSASSDKVDSLQSMVEQLKRERANLEQECTHLKKQLQSSESRNTSLGAALDDAEKELKAKSKFAEDSARALQDAERRLSVNHGDAESRRQWQDKAQSLEVEFLKLERELEQQKALADSFRVEALKHQDNADMAHKALRVARAHSEEHVAKLKEAKVDNVTLAAVECARDALAGELRHKDLRLQELEAHHETTRTVLEQVQREKVQLEEHVRELSLEKDHQTSSAPRGARGEDSRGTSAERPSKLDPESVTDSRSRSTTRRTGTKKRSTSPEVRRGLDVCADLRQAIKGMAERESSGTSMSARKYPGVDRRYSPHFGGGKIEVRVEHCSRSISPKTHSSMPTSSMSLSTTCTSGPQYGKSQMDVSGRSASSGMMRVGIVSPEQATRSLQSAYAPVRSSTSSLNLQVSEQGIISVEHGQRGRQGVRWHGTTNGHMCKGPGLNWRLQGMPGMLVAPRRSPSPGSPGPVPHQVLTPGQVLVPQVAVPPNAVPMNRSRDSPVRYVTPTPGR